MSVKTIRIDTGRRLGWILACPVGLFLGLTAHAQSATGNGDTPFHDHVAQAGVTSSCRSAVPAMGQRLTEGSQYMVRSWWDRQNPERHLIHSLIGMHVDTPDHTGPAMGYMLAAPMGDACETSLVRVTPFEKSCEEVARQFLGDDATAIQLQGLPTYTVADGGQVTTIPIGENCVVVSTAYYVVP